MEKEFCTYEQAIALKELGFDEPCFGYYDEGGNLYTEIVEVLKAPLYQQAFRWFREKYGLFGTVDKKDGIRFYKVEDENEKIIAVATSFKTYEEAELACLDKLIEICKNK